MELRRRRHNFVSLVWVCGTVLCVCGSSRAASEQSHVPVPGCRGSLSICACYGAATEFWCTVTTFGHLLYGSDEVVWYHRPSATDERQRWAWRQLIRAGRSCPKHDFRPVGVQLQAILRNHRWNAAQQNYGTFAPKSKSTISRTFAPWYFRSLELSFSGTFVPWNFRSRSLELLLPLAKVMWNFCSQHEI